MRPAGLQGIEGLTANAPALAEPVSINAGSQPDNSVSADDISVLEFLASRRTNLQTIQQPPLTSIGNVTASQAPEPMATGGVIVQVKPYIDTALPSQDTS